MSGRVEEKEEERERPAPQDARKCNSRADLVAHFLSPLEVEEEERGQEQTDSVQRPPARGHCTITI